MFLAIVVVRLKKHQNAKERPNRTHSPLETAQSTRTDGAAVIVTNEIEKEMKKDEQSATDSESFGDLVVGSESQVAAPTPQVKLSDRLKSRRVASALNNLMAPSYHTKCSSQGNLMDPNHLPPIFAHLPKPEHPILSASHENTNYETEHKLV